MRKVFPFIFLLIFSAGLNAQYQYDNPADKDYDNRFASWKVLVPSAMILYGITIWGNHGWPASSYDIQEKIQNKYPDFHTSLDDYIQFLPIVAVYALDLAGVKARHNFWDRSIMLAAGVGMSLAVVYSLKAMTHVLRPDSSAYNSMPSGHTAMAFAAATFMSKEYGHRSIWYSVGAYTVAALTGALRMLNNRHWLSDVLVGAGIGIIFTELAYLAYPAIKRKIALKKEKRAHYSIIPSFQQGYSGASLIIRF